MLLKKINLIILIALLLFNFLLADISQASIFSEVIKGFSKTGGAAGYELSGNAPKKEFAPAWMAYVDGMVGMMAALFMVLMIFAGYLWMTARGREEQVERAKRLIIEAIIGLALILGARLIVELAITALGTTLATSS